MKKDLLLNKQDFSKKNKKCIELIYLLNDVWKEIKMGEREKKLMNNNNNKYELF